LEVLRIVKREHLRTIALFIELSYFSKKVIFRRGYDDNRTVD
jgi:hypothetical protein